MRNASVILALMFCACTAAQDVGINGLWLLQTAPPAQLTTIFTPPLLIVLDPPRAPDLSVAEDTVATEEKAVAEKNAAMAEAPVARSTPRPTTTDMYSESKVVELITQIACEELRYPQRDLAASERRYRELAQALGFESRDPAKLQRTLRYYQSNTDFMRAHQHAIANNSLRCAMEIERVSAAP